MTDISVLHVVESFGGGVASAVRTYARTSSGVQHHLFCRVREGELATEGDDEVFSSVTVMPNNPRDALKALRQTVRKVAPDVVHAHSSLGGAITRLAIARRRRRRIVYTPHCYAFERRDLGALQRFVFRIAEMAMAWNTSVVAACSPRELALATRLRPKQRAVHVPNISTNALWSVPGKPAGTSLASSREFRIVVVGRIATQKDPDFLIEVISILRERRAVQVTWVGAGDEQMESRLRAAGVEVTGWISLGESAVHLASADLLLHTARWEAMPIVFLEANLCKLPMVVRRTPSLHWLGDFQAASTTREVAALAERVLTDPSYLSANRRAWSETFRDHTPTRQAQILQSIYRGMV